MPTQSKKHSATATEWLARFWRDPFALLIVVLAGLGTAHILVRTATYGAAVTHDSIGTRPCGGRRCSPRWPR